MALSLMTINLHPSRNHHAHLSSRMVHDSGPRPSLPSISSLIEAVGDLPDHRNNVPRRTSDLTSIYRSGSDRSVVGGTSRHLPPPRTPELPPPSSFDFDRRASLQHAPSGGGYRHGQLPQGSPSTEPGLYAQRSGASHQASESNLHRGPRPDNNAYSPTSRSARSNSIRDHHHHHPGAPPRPVSESGSSEASSYQGFTSQSQSQPPLRNTYPPSLPAADGQMPPTWQHHHYYPAANPPNYAQTQERYICPTCNKPFSRPSSLKIHTHSHTGEKPFRCNHQGCGKYFSVRSNMKRHEKGCHGNPGPSHQPSSP